MRAGGVAPRTRPAPNASNPARLSLTLLQIGRQLRQPLLVLARVVAAEEQFAPGGKDGADLFSCPATVAADGSGQVGAGECGVHVRSPSVPAPGNPMPSPAATTGSARCRLLFQTF